MKTKFIAWCEKRYDKLPEFLKKKYPAYLALMVLVFSTAMAGLMTFLDYYCR